MKTATLKELKNELEHYSQEELISVCLRLVKFKKENKEFLNYLLFGANNEINYIENIKIEIDEQFNQINTSSFYFIKKSIRKILKTIKKYIQYSQKNETEIELLIYFCQKLNKMKPNIHTNNVLKNLYSRQIDNIKRTIAKLHDDLQYDYNLDLNKLTEIIE